MLLKYLAAFLLVLGFATAEDPYRFFDWNVTYGDIYPLGVRQQVCIYNIFFYTSDIRGGEFDIRPRVHE